MQTITTIGLDIAKSVFQIHGVDGTGHDCEHPGDHELDNQRLDDDCQCR